MYEAVLKCSKPDQEGNEWEPWTILIHIFIL